MARKKGEEEKEGEEEQRGGKLERERERESITTKPELAEDSRRPVVDFGLERSQN